MSSPPIGMMSAPAEALLEEELQLAGSVEERQAFLSAEPFPARVECSWRHSAIGSVACLALGGAWWGLRGASSALLWNPGFAVQAQWNDQRQCTWFSGKDVMGDYMASIEESIYTHKTPDECRDTCERIQACGCYAWDASRGSTCWLKKGECTDFYEWGETPDMVSGACTGKVSVPPDAPSATTVTMTSTDVAPAPVEESDKTASPAPGSSKPSAKPAPQGSKKASKENATNSSASDDPELELHLEVGSPTSLRGPTSAPETIGSAPVPAPVPAPVEVPAPPLVPAPPTAAPEPPPPAPAAPTPSPRRRPQKPKGGAPSPLPPGCNEHGYNACTLEEGQAVDGEVLEEEVERSTAGECRLACEEYVDCGCFEFSPGESGSQCLLKKSPCSGFTDAEWPEGRVAGSCQTCDWCTPNDPVSPDLVIPFYERDMCKMRMTAASITIHDPKHLIGNVHLIWLSQAHPPSDFQDDLDHIVRAVNVSHRVKLHDLSYMFEQDGMPGWFVQQIVKLKASSIVEAPYYAILDAKNTFIKDVEPNTFMSVCNTGQIFADTEFDSLGEKMDWYHKSAEALGVSIPEGRKWSASVTPVIMHTQTVKDMLGHLKENPDAGKCCDGPLCGHIQNGATEFALYYTYAAVLTEQKCIHTTVPKSPATAFWRGVSAEWKESTCDWVRGGPKGLVMFGAQTGSVDDMSDDQKQRIAECMADIYDEAGLHDRQTNSDQSLLDCVLGG